MTAILTATPTFAMAPGNAPMTSWSIANTSDPQEIVYTNNGGAFSFQNGGWFVVNLQLSMMPQAQAGLARITWNKFPDLVYVVDAKVDGFYTLNSASFVFHANPNDAWRFEVSSPVALAVNADSRASKVTIYKLP